MHFSEGFWTLVCVLFPGYRFFSLYNFEVHVSWTDVEEEHGTMSVFFFSLALVGASRADGFVWVAGGQVAYHPWEWIGLGWHAASAARGYSFGGAAGLLFLFYFRCFIYA